MTPQSVFGDSSASLIHQATVTFANAQIQHLPSLSLEVVPAPAADYCLSLIALDLVARFTGGAYTNLDSDTQLYLAWGDDNEQASQVIQAVGVFGSDGNQYIPCTRFLSDPGWTFLQPDITATGNVSGEGFRLVVSNGGGDLTDGHDSNTLIVSVEFRVLNLAAGGFLTTAESGWNPASRTFA